MRCIKNSKGRFRRKQKGHISGRIVNGASAGEVYKQKGHTSGRIVHGASAGKVYKAKSTFREGV